MPPRPDAATSWPPSHGIFGSLHAPGSVADASPEAHNICISPGNRPSESAPYLQDGASENASEGWAHWLDPQYTLGLDRKTYSSDVKDGPYM